VPIYVPAATGLPTSTRLKHCDDYIETQRPIYENMLIARENLQMNLEFIAKQIDKAEHYPRQAIQYKRELQDILAQEEDQIEAEDALADPSQGLSLPSPQPATPPELDCVKQMLKAVHESSNDVATKNLIKKLEAKVQHNTRTQARRAAKRSADGSPDLDMSDVEEVLTPGTTATEAFGAPPVVEAPMQAASPVRLLPTEPADAPPGKRLNRKGNNTEPSIPACAVNTPVPARAPLVLGPRIASTRDSGNTSASASSDGIAPRPNSKKAIAAAKRASRALNNAAKAQAKEDKKVVKQSLK